MRMNKRLLILLAAFAWMILLSACRVGPGRYELTNCIGKSVSSFERKTGIKLEKQSNGVYLAEDVVQVMASDKDVTSVTLLSHAGSYTVYGVKIGMAKIEADQLLTDTLGKEVTKTADSNKNTVTYSYLKNENELYVSYDKNNKVVNLSYYKVEAAGREATEEPANTGELVAMIGDTKVYYNEAMVYLKSGMENYETEYGKGVWDADILGNGKTFGQMLKDEVMKQITELKIIRSEAEKQGITLTEDEMAQADTYAKEHYDGLTQEDRDKYKVTEDLLKQVYLDNLLADKVFETLTINVDTNVSDQDAKQVTVQQILIYSTDFDEKGNKVPMSTEDKQAAYEKAQSLLDQAKTTQDFKALAEANSQNDTIEYTFGKGQGPKEFSKAFEQAAFSLKTGEVSDIITTDYGWHILYCVTDFNEDATTQAKEDIIDQRRSDAFAKLYSDWSKEYDIVINNEVWDKVSLN